MLEKLQKFRAEHHKKKEALRSAHRVSESGFSDFILYLRSPWQIIWNNFLAGIFRGLGFVIGATAVLALVVYILVRVLGNLPWVGQFFQEVGQFVQDIEETAKHVGK